MRVDEAAVRRRREQNLAAARPDTRGIAPSISSFAQAIDRQRQAIERVPVLAASRPDLAEAARAAAVALPRAGEALFAAVPRRILVLALDPAAAVRGRADALLDEALGSAPDPAAAFRSALEEG